MFLLALFNLSAVGLNLLQWHCCMVTYKPICVSHYHANDRQWIAASGEKARLVELCVIRSEEYYEKQ